MECVAQIARSGLGSSANLRRQQIPNPQGGRGKRLPGAVVLEIREEEMNELLIFLVNAFYGGSLQRKLQGPANTGPHRTSMELLRLFN
jgi:hypothetical protein